MAPCLLRRRRRRRAGKRVGLTFGERGLADNRFEKRLVMHAASCLRTVSSNIENRFVRTYPKCSRQGVN